MCAALVASLTEEMAARSFAYHTHGTADGDFRNEHFVEGKAEV